MMTQVLATRQPQPDALALAQAEEEDYLEEQAYSFIAPSFQALSGSTESILYHTFWLQERKEALSKKDYRRLLSEHGWKGEESRYLRVAIAFQDFSPLQLSLVEPRTIFQLAENLKKYQRVIEAMRELETITQFSVRELIQQQRKPRLPKPEEKPTVWRQTGSGPRYVQIPPIHEEDEQTGLVLQQMIESESLTAQAVIRDAIALRQAYKEGRLVEVKNLSLDIEGEFEVADFQDKAAFGENLSLGIEKETDVADCQESIATSVHNEATEEIAIACEHPALFTLQTDSQPTERLVKPQPPTLTREEKSLYEMGILDEEEFGDGETEVAIAFQNSEDRLNAIQWLLEEYQIEAGMEENLGGFRASRRIKEEIKKWQEQKKREIWQADQFAKAVGIKVEVYEVGDGDSIAEEPVRVSYEYRMSR
jgi:hypothetical protein